ncbi:cytochrome b/b6 domain-containing protein [soil metagenome]
MRQNPVPHKPLREKPLREKTPREKTGRLHPWPLRIMHWINALAMLTMIGSGWKIYNDEVLFGWLHFPDWITIGGEAQGALQWHFFAMWMLMLNGLAYLAYGLVTGRFRAKFLPIRLREILADVRDALAFRLAHGDITHYNAVQKLLYTGVIAVIVVQVFSGWAIWKPVQLSELLPLFGGFQGGRLVHFLGMAAIVGFLLVHVALALIVPRTIGAMITGGPTVNGPEASDAKADAPAVAPSS